MLKNARRRPTCKIASKRVRFCRYRCCFAHAMHAKIAQNHWKFTIKSSQKNTNAVVAMVRNARCRSTCEHASKRVDFCCSRSCFAHAMDAKFVQNSRKSAMATCNLSTVVPAARRANSKCIFIKEIRKQISTIWKITASQDTQLLLPQRK